MKILLVVEYGYYDVINCIYYFFDINSGNLIICFILFLISIFKFFIFNVWIFIFWSINLYLFFF